MKQKVKKRAAFYSSGNFVLRAERECTPSQFKCATGGKCIEGIYKCDGRADCPDRSDEDCPISNETLTHTVSLASTPYSMHKLYSYTSLTSNTNIYL